LVPLVLLVDLRVDGFTASSEVGVALPAPLAVEAVLGSTGTDEAAVERLRVVPREVAGVAAVVRFRVVPPEVDAGLLPGEPPAPFTAAGFLTVALSAVGLSAFALPPADDGEIADSVRGAGFGVGAGGDCSPETTALRVGPGVNCGTAAPGAGACLVVRALRALRAAGLTTFFSKAPNPAIATFSPRATSRVTVATTDSRACRAARLLPSKWLDNASMS
jgi:hypothetical protein